MEWPGYSIFSSRTLILSKRLQISGGGGALFQLSIAPLNNCSDGYLSGREGLWKKRCEWGPGEYRKSGVRGNSAGPVRLRRARRTIGRGSGERLAWSDEDARAHVTSKFLGSTYGLTISI